MQPMRLIAMSDERGDDRGEVVPRLEVDLSLGDSFGHGGASLARRSPQGQREGRPPGREL